MFVLNKHPSLQHKPSRTNYVIYLIMLDSTRCDIYTHAHMHTHADTYTHKQTNTHTLAHIFVVEGIFWTVQCTQLRMYVHCTLLHSLTCTHHCWYKQVRGIESMTRYTLIVVSKWYRCFIGLGLI